MPAMHSMLSPSSAKRWIHCPPSAKINAKAERKDTFYTEEGTLAHTLAEIKARKYFYGYEDPDAYGTLFEDVLHSLKALERRYGVKDGDGFDAMDKATDAYVDALKALTTDLKLPCFVDLEQEIELAGWVPDGFGTADCVIISDGILQVVDFKYGKGVPVEAEHNEQMMLYALGAYRANSIFYDIHTVRMTIVQPRIGEHVSTWEVRMDDLLHWAEDVLAPAARLAAEGRGEMRCGSWCRWCANEQLCRARAEFFSQAASEREAEPEYLKPDELAALLERFDGIGAWYDGLKEAALLLSLNGTEVPGFKAVEGRSVREWTDREEAFDDLIEDGIPEAMLYEKKPLSLSAVEKLVGRKKFKEICEQYIDRPAGKPALVPESDKRPAITRPTAKNDFFDQLKNGGNE